MYLLVVTGVICLDLQSKHIEYALHTYNIHIQYTYRTGCIHPLRYYSHSRTVALELVSVKLVSGEADLSVSTSNWGGVALINSLAHLGESWCRGGPNIMRTTISGSVEPVGGGLSGRYASLLCIFDYLSTGPKPTE